MNQTDTSSNEDTASLFLPDASRVQQFSDQEPGSDSAWCTWLTGQRKLEFQVYELKPDQLIADSRRERSITRDYEGREILELLQNASDAAQTVNELGRIHIELSSDGLIIANTGASFTRGGIISLQTADLSPKRDRKRTLIGSKGLGFRSILNWSRQPIILSGSLQLGYSFSHAKMAIRDMAARTPQISTAIDREVTTGNYPVPLLKFPMWLGDDNLLRSLDRRARTILARCQILQKNGYVTAIGMPFDREEAHKNALDQLNQLQPEFLLFSEAIREITVSFDQQGVTKWLREEEGPECVLLDVESGNIRTQTRWKLFKRNGVIPADLLRDESDPNAFNIVVALPEDGLAKPANLYSFFPTSVQLPLPVLCHATLELEQNRKRFQQIESNEHVLRMVAEHILEIAEQISSDGTNLWRGIDILKPRKDFPLDLSVLEGELTNGAREKKILPTLTGEVVRPVESHGLPGASVDWLPVRLFGDVAAARDTTDLEFYRRLGLVDLESQEFRQRIASARDLSITERASLVSGIIRNNLKNDYHDPGLLIDSGGQRVSADDRVFLPGEYAVQRKSLPAWARVKVLDGKLWQEINSRLDAGRARDTRRLLDSFGVQEYALGNLIRGLIASGNRAIDETATVEDGVRREMIETLFALFPADLPREKRPSFPDNSTVRVPSQAGSWVPADTAYLGAGYSISGIVMQELMARHPEKLVVAPNDLHISALTPNVMSEFLIWLGVNEWPRDVEIRDVPQKFVKYALHEIDYPAVFENGYIYQAQADIERPRFERVLSIDQIDSILAANPVAILAWLAHDHRTLRWAHLDEQNGRLNCLPARMQNTRRFLGALPSYVNWLIKTTSWLPDSLNRKVPPVDCMLGDRSIEGIFPRPQRPSTDGMKQFGLNSQDIQFALLRAGVPSGLSNLDSEDIYALLRELPDRNPDGKAAKRLYRWLLEASDLEPDVTGPNYQLFATKGQLWAKRGDKEGYYSVQEALHVDMEGLPIALLESLVIADLPKKRGSAKVSRLFAIKSVDRVAVAEKVEHHVSAPCAQLADSRLQECKPYIRALRQSLSPQLQQLDLLDRLRLEVATEITAVVRYGDQSVKHRIRPWHYAIQEDILYVACEPSRPADVSPALLANAVGNAIASIFGLSDGSVFAQIYQCEEMDRKYLLVRLLGEEQESDVDELLGAAGRDAEESQLTIHLPIDAITINGQAATQIPAVVESANTGTRTPDILAPFDTDNRNALGAWTTPENINVEQILHVPTPMPAHIDIKVTVPGGGAGGAQSRFNKVIKADGEVGEQLTVMFELKAGRYPLRVGHITGYLAPGCDVLSFRSSEERDAFRSGQERNSALVERFVEAKARSAGIVELTGHEWNAARQWGARYFVYRFERDLEHPQDYLLTTLRDPQAAVEAQIPIIQLSLDRAQRAERYKIHSANAFSEATDEVDDSPT